MGAIALDLDLPADLHVQACWALLNNGPGAIPPFTLHRFTNVEDEAQTWPIDIRSDASRLVDPQALQVARAAGDAPALLDAWILVDDATRELLLSDPSFRGSSTELFPAA